MFGFSSGELETKLKSAEVLAKKLGSPVEKAFYERLKAYVEIALERARKGTERPTSWRRAEDFFPAQDERSLPQGTTAYVIDIVRNVSVLEVFAGSPTHHKQKNELIRKAFIADILNVKKRIDDRTIEKPSLYWEALRSLARDLAQKGYLNQADAMTLLNESSKIE